MNQYKKLGFNDSGGHLEKQVILTYILFVFLLQYPPLYRSSPSFDLMLKLLHQWTKSYGVHEVCSETSLAERVHSAC